MKKIYSTVNCKRRQCITPCGEPLWEEAVAVGQDCRFDDIVLKHMDPDSQRIGTPANAALPRHE